MTIQITDQELRDYKATLVLHYTSAVVDFLNEIEPFVEQNLKKKFEKEVNEARANFQDKLKKTPTFVSI